MMAHESKSVLDYVLLVVVAVVAVVLVMLFLLLMGKSGVLAYSLALLALIVWPAVAPVAARRLIKEKVYWVLFHAWGTYVLVLAYVIGHRLPFPGVVGYINGHYMILLGVSYGLSVGAHNYLEGKRRKISRKPRQHAPKASLTP